MKTFTEYLAVKTEKRIEFINITKKIELAVKKSKIKEGIALVNSNILTELLVHVYKFLSMRRQVLSCVLASRRGIWIELFIFNREPYLYI